MGDSAFPSDFKWGVATAAYQIEGAFETDGRGPSIWDTYSHTPGKTANGETGDVAVDHYHRFGEDVEIMAELGVSAYRFSISWSRLIPKGVGDLNPAGVDFYRRLCAELIGAGIEPVATLYHWDLPQALQDRGGWLSDESAGWFGQYAGKAKQSLGDLIHVWTTLNEPWCSAFLGHSAGEHAPGFTEPGLGFVAAHNLMLAHHEAIRVMRDTNPSPLDQLGVVLNLIPAWPATDSPQDQVAAADTDAVQNGLFADAVFHGRYPERILEFHERFGVQDGIDLKRLAETVQPIDYLGINYYNVNRVIHEPGAVLKAWPGVTDATMATPPGDLTEMGWGVEPEGLTWMLQRVSEDYPGLPLFICENGAAYPDVVDADGNINDDDRIAYVEGHLAAVADAIAKGVDVRGYFLWSLLDNFEWARGYDKLFGIVHVDRNTMKRTIKKSGHWYRDFVATVQS